MIDVGIDYNSVPQFGFEKKWPEPGILDFDVIRNSPPFRVIFGTVRLPGIPDNSPRVV